jgi:type I restriction enzyme S subunit
MSNQNNDIPEGLKMTELGLLPKEWEVASLNKIATINKSSIDPQSYPAESFDYYSIPAYQITNDPIIETGINIHSQKLVISSGTILFGKLNPRVPKVWLVESLSDRRKIASTEFIPLTPTKELVISAFLYYLAWSKYVMTKAQEFVSGSTPSRQRVDTTSFSRIPVPLPPLPEQKAITRVLSTIQRAIETQDKIISAAKELKKSLMRHLFTYGPVPVAVAVDVPLKETEIGQVPQNWELVRLGDVIDKPGYGFTETASSEIIGPKFLRITDIQNGVVNWTSVPYCKCSSVEEEKYRLKSGDILFARIGATT